MTIWLVIIFFFTQLVGLLIISQNIDFNQSVEEGKITFEELPFDMERPPIAEQTSFLYLISAILIATVLVLVLMRFRKVRLWKFWFFLSVGACITIALVKTVGENIALLIGFGLGYWKVFKPNVVIHNLTELLIYGGLAVIFVPIMNVFAAIAMLLVISVYDMIAVWQSKHMIKLAEFQKESKVFAGLNIPYKLGKIGKKVKGAKQVKVKSAILGGGDIGFPLIFAGVVLKHIALDYTFGVALLKVLIISLCATIALFLLLFYAKKDRYYPAMPFITAGCLIGYSILLL